MGDGRPTCNRVLILRVDGIRGYGDSHGDSNGDSCGYGMGMGIETPSPRQPCYIYVYSALSIEGILVEPVKSARDLGI